MVERAKKEEQILENQRYVMSQLFDKKVSEHNDLIQSVANMDAVPLKIFELAVAHVDPKNPPVDNTVCISKKLLFSFFNANDTNKENRFKLAIEKMQTQAFFQLREEKGKGWKYRSINPIPTVEWNSYTDDVFLEFNRHVIPYLVNFNGKFTKYAIMDIANLKKKYPIILYKWISMNFNQYEYYQKNPHLLKKASRRKEQLEEYQNPTISVDELRKLTGTTKSYSHFSNFESKVIKEAVEEISEFTTLNVTYEKIQKGKQISEIKFFVERTKMLAPLSDKTEEEEELTEEQRKAQVTERYTKAISSQYTKLLIEKYQILSYEDLANMDLMAEMQRKVYPDYDRLRENLGENEVERHLARIQERKIEYIDTSKNNILEYLSTSIKGYLTKLINDGKIQPFKY